MFKNLILIALLASLVLAACGTFEVPVRMEVSTIECKYAKVSDVGFDYRNIASYQTEIWLEEDPEIEDLVAKKARATCEEYFSGLINYDRQLLDWYTTFDNKPEMLDYKLEYRYPIVDEASMSGSMEKPWLINTLPPECPVLSNVKPVICNVYLLKLAQ